MIEATCVACGKLLGRFITTAGYIQWREKHGECDCGASLAAALFTRYTKAEKAEEAKPGEEPPPEETRLTDSFGGILKGRRK